MKDTELRKIQKEGLHKLSDKAKLKLFIDGKYNDLIKAHILYFQKLALSFAYNDRDKASEFLAIMLEGAALSLTKFNPDKSPYVSSYICNSGKNKMMEHLTRINTMKRSGVTVEYLDYKDQREDEDYILQENKDIKIDNKLNELFETLKPKDKKIMELLRQGKTQREVALLQSCTHQNIHAKVQRIISDLQSHI